LQAVACKDGKKKKKKKKKSQAKPTEYPDLAIKVPLARCQWLTPVILATQEAEIRRIEV
jgi:hypothetical protein